MRFQFLFFSILTSAFIMVSSCSSDPCEDVICVNGSCNEGICDCAEGWKGPSCDEVDYNFIGEFRSTALSLIQCPAGATEGTLNTNLDNEVCYAEGEWTICLEVLMRFEADETFFLNVITSRSNGSIRIGDPTVIEGTYTTDGNTATICDGTCNQMSLDMTQNELTWIQQQGSSTDCGISWVLTRQ